MGILDDLKNKIINADATLNDTEISPVIPAENKDNISYKTVRGEDFREVFSSIDIQKTNIINYIKLIMPKYTRRVQVEDLNKNIWVIGNCISALIDAVFHSEFGMEEIWEAINGLIAQNEQLEEEVNTLQTKVDGGEIVDIEIEAPEYNLHSKVNMSDISIKLISKYGERSINLNDIDVKSLLQDGGNIITTAYKAIEKIFVYYDNEYYTYTGGQLTTENESYFIDNLYNGNYTSLLSKLVFVGSSKLTKGEIMFLHIGESNPAFQYLGNFVLSSVKDNNNLFLANALYQGFGVQQNYQLYQGQWIKYENLIVPRKTNLFTTQQKTSASKYIRQLKEERRNNIFVEFFRPESTNMPEKTLSKILDIDVYFASLNKENISSNIVQRGNILDNDLEIKGTLETIPDDGLRYTSTLYPLLNADSLPIHESFNLFAKGSHICKTKGVSSGKWWSDFFLPNNSNSPFYYVAENAAIPFISSINYLKKIEEIRTESGDWQLTNGEVELPSIIPFGITGIRYALKGVKIERVVLTSSDERGRCPSDIKLIGVINSNTLDNNMANSNSAGTKRYNVAAGDNQDGVYYTTSTKLFASSATIEETTNNYWQNILENKWNNSSYENPYEFILDSGELNMGFFYDYCLVSNKDNGSSYQKSSSQIGIGKLYVTAQNALPFYPKLESDF